MTPEDAHGLLKDIASINGLEKNLKKYDTQTEEVEKEKSFMEEAKANVNRHYFKDIEFFSSLTGKKYRGTTAINGVLSIIDIETNTEIPNHNKPSKKDIVGQAILDLGHQITKDETLYQRYHKLTNIILSQAK